MQYGIYDSHGNQVAQAIDFGFALTITAHLNRMMRDQVFTYQKLEPK